MSARSTRRPQIPLNSLESLLLAQAVWVLGAGPDSWASIAKILFKHPLLSRPKSFFSAQSCNSMYEALMKEAGVEMDESNNAPHAPANLQLAQKHYHSRFLELQDLILAEELKFKAVLREIEEIRAGIWDKDIQSENSGQLHLEHAQQPTTPFPDKPDEVFGGSDLSGITESNDSSGLGDLVTSTTFEDERRQQESHKELSADVEEDGLTERDGESPSLSSIHQDTTADIPNGNFELVGQIPEPDSMEEVASEQPVVAVEVDEEINQVPEITPEAVANQDDNVEQSEPEQSVRMDDINAPESVEVVEQDIVIRTHETTSQRQEVHKEEESKVEKEETSQELENEYQEEAELEGQVENSRGSEPELGDALTRSGQNVDEEGDPNSGKSAHPTDVETDSELAHTPAAVVIGFEEEAEPVVDEGHSSETEPVAPTRRSTRRRKSSVASVPPPQTRTRLRSQAQLSETELQVPADSENDGDTEAKENTPAVEDEHASSPFDGVVTRRRDSKRKASFLESAGSPPDKKRLREDSEPVDEEEPGPSSHSTRTRVTRHATKTEEQVALKRFQNVIGMLHSQISQHRNGNIFHNPIKNSEAPDYHEIVKRPMDLKTIKTRVKDGVIANSLEFQRDIYLMFANAMMYNRPGSDVHAMAEDMMLESEGQITAFRQTEGLVKRGQRP